VEPNDGAPPNAEAEAEGEPKGFETPNPEFPAVTHMVYYSS